jgi:hypothetical protein
MARWGRAVVSLRLCPGRTAILKMTLFTLSIPATGDAAAAHLAHSVEILPLPP